jgi:hypothetical protein
MDSIIGWIAGEEAGKKTQGHRFAAIAPGILLSFDLKFKPDRLCN